MKNFEFEHEGKKYWYSRSLAASAILSAKDENGETKFLLIKRGDGCEFHAGEYGLVGGYLDFDESIVDCCKREIFEETGLDLKDKSLKLEQVLDEPKYSRFQNITFIFSYSFDQHYVTINSKLTDKYADKNEINSYRWINIQEFDKIKTMYNQEAHKAIKALMEQILKKNIY
jgi:8-oxo-dGTP pyrophosphatase MutT (NUDIX family)